MYSGSSNIRTLPVTGRQNLCDRGLYAGVGYLQDETFRFHRSRDDYGGFCALGAFSVERYTATPGLFQYPFVRSSPYQ